MNQALASKKVKNTIRVFEHIPLKLGEHDGARFTKEHLDALVKFNEKNGDKYFMPVYNGIKFTQYVGVIKIGKLTIEILPKADKDKEGDKEKWHNILMDMLRYCKLLELESVSNANLRFRSNSILEMYIEVFLFEVEMMVRQGLTKKYRRHEGNLTALKGRMDFSKQISRNLIHKERFYTHYITYDRQHLLNQLLLKTLKLLPKLTNNPIFFDKINRLIIDFPDLPDLKVEASTFEKITLDRKTIRYKTAINISKMFLLNYSPDIRGGSNDLLAILFDMNELFEEYIFRRLKKEEAKHGIEVRRQVYKKFWESKGIKPDIVILRKSDKRTIVLDTKWKILDAITPSDDDLKQMYVYNHYYGCEMSALVYPMVKFDEVRNGTYRLPHVFTIGSIPIAHGCQIVFAEVNTEGELNVTLAEEILTRINIID